MYSINNDKQTNTVESLTNFQAIFHCNHRKNINNHILKPIFITINDCD